MWTSTKIAPASTLFECKRYQIIVTPLKPGHVLTTTFGYNDGQIHDPVHAELDRLIEEAGFLVAYMDCREQMGMAAESREKLTAWAKTLGPRYRRGHLLFRSKLLEMALAIGNLVIRSPTKGYSSAEEFERVIAADVPGFTHLPFSTPPTKMAAGA